VVEISHGVDGNPDCVSTYLQVLDHAGGPHTGAVDLRDLLVAAVDIVGSVYLQEDWPNGEEEFVELVERLLQAAMVDMVVTDVH
jgi:hypothetical protein